MGQVHDHRNFTAQGLCLSVRNLNVCFVHVFRMLLVFLVSSEKDGARFSYPHKIQLSAFWRQSTHGPFTPEKFGDVGFFDFVGNDRRYV